MRLHRILSIALGLVFGVWCLMCNANAQDQAPATKTQTIKSKSQTPQQKSPTKKEIKAGFGVTVVQTQPQFPGGDDSLVTYLKRNIHYPKESQQKKEQGQVYVGFMIDTLGKVRDARVVSSVSTDLDTEAMRVVQAMPDWKPGTAGGSAINVHWVLPVDFVLPKQEQ